MFSPRGTKRGRVGNDQKLEMSILMAKIAELKRKIEFERNMQRELLKDHVDIKLVVSYLNDAGPEEYMRYRTLIKELLSLIEPIESEIKRREELFVAEILNPDNKDGVEGVESEGRN
ncbi:hypothetical protein vseg_001689 [Gypsophila vaccaria]